MTGAEDPPAASYEVVVVGAGVAGLVAARDLALGGQTVAVVDAADHAGGAVASHTVGGLVLDSGAESFAVRGGSVAELARQLGLGDDLVSPHPTGAWLQWQGGAAPLPKRTLLGIPGVPLADDVRAIIGWRGALRAQLDRYRPLLRVRPEGDLGSLVERRMGRLVLDRLVAPVVGGVHSTHPDLADVHAVAPGLAQAMTVQGSLSGAVMSMLTERDRAAHGKPGAAVGGIRGGVHRLVDELVASCERFGVDLRLGARVGAIEAVGELTRDASARVRLEDGGVLTARAVVVATPLAAAIGLLETAGVAVPPAVEWPGSSAITLVTLVLDDARLDAAPRGTGVLVAEDTQTVGAKALTHATVKWDWLASEAGPGRHVLRLSYGRHGSAASPARPDLVDVALTDASVLLGIPLDRGALVDSAVVEWRDSLAFATLGHSSRVKAVAASLAGFPRLEVVGGWFDGTGLASILTRGRPRVQELATRLRSA